ncbi:glycine--tRNA ligase subunit beta [Rhodobaculum claviforme]|uniref:Glycine--tRNA ligase beta subunit n=1 Tax=Rhodobaculum claviforme TaxID=1549854 RepID=A0A934THZ7_9RHOB|nr:glycine--tRNA ligase subunit beta [Rhodobaculum claviforme]MBK5926227.1 glycine--tRNA ligase subunit beta [Rhodobaculum claviforme]
MPDLLIELLSEEIPARMQARAAEDLKRLVTQGLVDAGLTYAGARAFATPRRLALTVAGLTAASATRREERKGPREGAPDAAIEGFARSAGVARDALELRDAGKARAWFAVTETPGRPAAAIVAEVLEATVRGFPWPKSMRWGTGSLRWVRPLHAILCLLSDEGGAQVVEMEIDGIKASDRTRGHRFMAPGAFSVTSFDDYRAKLRRAHVLLDAEERADHIWVDAHNAAFAQGLEVVEDRALLAEVAGLVEWPVVLMGSIAPEFLDLPPEVLQTSMREHQKFFSVRNPATGRIEKFVTVAARETADDGATILAGNAKVLAARLSDAKFFWQNDLRTVSKVGLEGMAEGLSRVTFHNKLGTQADRIARIAALAREIAPMVGADPDLAEQAARVAKADLQSEMVGEFPELQGLMGRYYAEAAGLPAEVAAACPEHYQPLGPSDSVPSAPVSVAVALADKLDTLTGFFWINERPTGSKDPFALRRAALGVIRLLVENRVRIPLFYRVFYDHETFHMVTAMLARQEASEKISAELIKRGVDPKSLESFTPSFTQVISSSKYGIGEEEAGMGSLLVFLHDRLKVHLRDQGIRHDVIDACLTMPNNDDLTLLVARAEALQGLLATEDGENLVQGFRRANNILTQAEARDGVEYSFGPDPKLAEGAEEVALFAALDAAEAAIGPAMEAEDFAAAMRAMAQLRAPIDAFFEAVQINTDNQIVRRNRLNLLHRIRTICLGVADLTRLEG